jgi:hypothetical protein
MRLKELCKLYLDWKIIELKKLTARFLMSTELTGKGALYELRRTVSDKKFGGKKMSGRSV